MIRKKKICLKEERETIKEKLAKGKLLQSLLILLYILSKSFCEEPARRKTLLKISTMIPS